MKQAIRFFTDAQLEYMRRQHEKLDALGTVFKMQQKARMVAMHTQALLELQAANIKFISPMAKEILGARQ